MLVEKAWAGLGNVFLLPFRDGEMFGSIKAARVPCCGAPFCADCMLKWWNMARAVHAPDLHCPWCSRKAAVIWFNWRIGANYQKEWSNGQEQDWHFPKFIMRATYCDEVGELVERRMKDHFRFVKNGGLVDLGTAVPSIMADDSSDSDGGGGPGQRDDAEVDAAGDNSSVDVGEAELSDDNPSDRDE